MAALADWTTLPELKDFSGTAGYVAEVTLPGGLPSGARVVLDLGAVHEVAAVRINGKEAAKVWMQPYRVEVTAQLDTTITTLAGLLPLALSHGQGSETWQPLGITMISGLTVSTLITMLFVPTLYSIFESHLKKAKKA